MLKPKFEKIQEFADYVESKHESGEFEELLKDKVAGLKGQVTALETFVKAHRKHLMACKALNQLKEGHMHMHLACGLLA